MKKNKFVKLSDVTLIAGDIQLENNELIELKGGLMVMPEDGSNCHCECKEGSVKAGGTNCNCVCNL